PLSFVFRRERRRWPRESNATRHRLFLRSRIVVVRSVCRRRRCERPGVDGGGRLTDVSPNADRTGTELRPGDGRRNRADCRRLFVLEAMKTMCRARLRRAELSLGVRHAAGVPYGMM